MENGNYPRQDYVPSGPYPGDKTWGIVIIVLAAIGVCFGAIVTLGGAALGTVGAASAANANAPAGSSAAAGLAGGFIAMMGIALIALCALEIVAGVGIMNSKRWAFILVAVVSALNILASLANLKTGILSIVVSGIFLWYSYQRLSGKVGPPPL